jgi:hypothetical protein
MARKGRPTLFVVAEELVEHLLGVREERVGDAVVLRATVGYFANARRGELVNRRLGIGHDDRRLRGDDELGLLSHSRARAERTALGTIAALGNIHRVAD